MWYLVNRGTPDAPLPSGFAQPGIGNLLGVYSTPERAGAVAGPGSTFLGMPMPEALGWLASFGEQGVAGVVMDHPGPWLALGTLSYLERWVPAGGVQDATDAYLAAPDDGTYAEVVRQIAGSRLFVVLDPQGDGSTPTSIVNHRDERLLLAFSDAARLTAFYDGKAVTAQQRAGADLLRLVGGGFDVLILDPQHPASFAATPESIRAALG
ncbi:SseB family protein [Nocardioides sp. W3-2-3]|uniref:SseB family protein n=1 Tax=Nocardioides convexus TaxID=2712224 RepID=UPI0024187E89|nr:SseB family protein [Nocardioides convexus]NHA01701.1 SseB family protein [Nocardioides convexus]